MPPSPSSLCPLYPSRKLNYSFLCHPMQVLYVIFLSQSADEMDNLGRTLNYWPFFEPGLILLLIFHYYCFPPASPPVMLEQQKQNPHFLHFILPGRLLTLTTKEGWNRLFPLLWESLACPSWMWARYILPANSPFQVPTLSFQFDAACGVKIGIWSYLLAFGQPADDILETWVALLCMYYTSSPIHLFLQSPPPLDYTFQWPKPAGRICRHLPTIFTSRTSGLQFCF